MLYYFRNFQLQVDAALEELALDVEGLGMGVTGVALDAEALVAET